MPTGKDANAEVVEKREPILNFGLLEVVIVAVTLCIGAGMVGAVVVVIFQCMDWLKTGAWHPLPADWVWDAVGLHLPVTKMVGAERIIEWFVWVASPAPLAVTALIAGFLPPLVLLIAVTCVTALRTDIANNRAKRTERKLIGPHRVVRVEC